MSDDTRIAATLTANPDIAQVKHQPDCYVTTSGRVYRVVELHPDARGTVALSVDHKPRIWMVVANAFIPNPNNLQRIRHIDGDKGNNHISNLEWVAYGHYMPRGEDHYAAKLTKRDVQEIRLELEKGSLPSKIALDYGVACSTIVQIRDGRSWEEEV